MPLMLLPMPLFSMFRHAAPFSPMIIELRHGQPPFSQPMSAA